MQQQPPGPNRYDEAVKDYFHSKTFKTIMTVISIILVIVFLCVCIFFFVSFGGMVVIGNWLNS